MQKNHLDINKVPLHFVFYNQNYFPVIPYQLILFEFFAAKAVIKLESTPPLNKIPTGTSAINCFFT